MLATEERLPFQPDLQVRGRTTLAFNSVKPEATKVHCTASLRGPLHVCAGAVSSARPSTAQLTNDTAAPPQPLPSRPLAQLSSRPELSTAGHGPASPGGCRPGAPRPAADPGPPGPRPRAALHPLGAPPDTRAPGPDPRLTPPLTVLPRQLPAADTSQSSRKADHRNKRPRTAQAASHELPTRRSQLPTGRTIFSSASPVSSHRPGPHQVGHGVSWSLGRPGHCPPPASAGQQKESPEAH